MGVLNEIFYDYSLALLHSLHYCKYINTLVSGRPASIFL